ncbi:tape measure protein, partial [bacterium]|nr:tape measure protein [bacterium]
MAIAGTLTYKTELDTDGVKKSGNVVKSIIAGLGITKMISKAMDTITSSIDGAISRYDTLNNFPKVMSNLGISSKKAEKAIKKMSDKLSGLPTTLDQGAMAVQRFTSRNGDVEKSTDIFLALNNAILAGGASTEIQSNALEQMAQAYAKGKPDMMEWRSIMTAMPAQLNQVAEAMGYGKHGADDLGEALRQGDVSMDKFMDTIVKLNEKGTSNFKNFEEQARNSTDGINTAITVAKTQVVKGVASIIGSIDKSLKKSGTSIGQIISNLGKKAKQVLDGIAKVIEKINFKKIYEILKKIVPVIVTATSAWIAYQLAIKAIALINIASTIISATTAFIKLIPSIKSANDAMTLLNMTFKANPVALLVGALGGLVAILAIVKAKNNELTESQKQYQEQLEKEKQALEEQTEKVKESKDAWDDLQQQKQKSIDAGMSEMSYYESLYDELQSITDENGKVKKGYEDRANFIVGQLNDALGLEISMNNGVIKGYKEIKEKIQEVIDKKKAQIILEAQEQTYKEAIQGQSEALSELRKIEEELTTEKEKKLKLNQKLELAEKDLEEARKSGSLQEQTLAEARVSQYKNEISLSDERLATLKNNYNTQKDLIKSYAFAVGQYEKNLELSHKGEYDKMSVATWNYVRNFEDASDAEKAQLEENVKNTEEHLKILKDLKEKSGEDIYDAQIKSAEKQLKQQKQDLKKYESATKESLEKNNLLWNDNLDQQLTILTGKNITFKKVGNGNIDAYINGIKVKE